MLMKSRILGCLGTVLALVFILSVALNVFFLLFHGEDEDSRQTKKLSEQVVLPATGKGKAKIAQIDIEGLISNDSPAGDGTGGTMVESTKRALRQAVEDADVKAIVIRVDSPGGEVTASDTLFHAVQQAQAKKPVIVYMDSIAASGGYYLSCGASKIVANENTWTGSIGVIVQGVGFGPALEKLGLEMRVFRSGDFKDTFYGQREMTDDEKSYVQSMVMQTYDRFVKIVSDARKIPVEKLKAEIADGRVYSGADALKIGLIDQTGYIETAYDLAKSAATPAKVQVDLTGGLLPRLQAGRCYLLPASYVQ